MSKKNYVEPMVSDSKGNLYVSINYHIEILEQLQQRIEKAIKYIENNRNTCYMDEDITYLLNTLKGEENDNK